MNAEIFKKIHDFKHIWLLPTIFRTHPVCSYRI